MPTIKQFLRNAQEILTKAGIPDPRLEPEIMVSNILQIKRHMLYTSQDTNMPKHATDALSKIIRRRLRREPLAYILGHQEFYGIDLLVGPSVMVPRPETELIVERSISLCSQMSDADGLVVADVGTGSGGIAIAIALHLPQAKITATDISSEALDVAATNIRMHKVEERITLCQGDLLATIEAPVDAIVANLPYICTNRLKEVQMEVQMEPVLALDGGPDGTVLNRRLLWEAKEKLSPRGVILLEIDPEQQRSLAAVARRCFPAARVSVEKDLAGMGRILVLESPI